MRRIAALAIILLFSVNIQAATGIVFSYPDDTGDSARYVAYDAAGDSVNGGTMTETTAGEGAKWTATPTLAAGRYTIWGYVKEGLTIGGFVSYELIVEPSTFDVSTDDVTLGTGEITTSTFAAGAINNNVVADDFLTASKIATDAIGSSELASSAAAEIEDSVYQQRADYKADVTGMSTFDATTDSVIIANKAQFAARNADSTWNSIITDHTITNSIADVLYDSLDAVVSSAGGTATVSDADMAAIIDTLFKRLPGDTVSGSYLGKLLEFAVLAGDTSQWADLSDVWRNQDTTNVDSSAIGAWIENNSGAAAASNWSNAQRDSVLDNIADAGKLGAILDSIELYDTRFDSLLAAVSDGSMGDKIWVDAATRTLTAYLWNTTQRDSVLDALTDAAMGDKVWQDPSTRTLSAYLWNATEKDSVLTSLEDQVLALKVWNQAFATVFTAGSMGDSLSDASYVQGSVAGLTAAEIMDSLFARGVAAYAEAYYAEIALRADSGSVSGGGSDTTAIKEMMDNNPDIVQADVSALSTHSEVDVYSQFTAGTNEDAFKATTTVPADTNTSGDTLATMPESWTAADSAGFQGAASGLSVADIADGVWDEVQSGHTTAGTFGSYLDTAISSIGLGGVGAFTITTVVVDSGAAVDSVLTGVKVYANNPAQDTKPWEATTLNTGAATFQLDAGTYVRFITTAGFAPKLDTFTVSATSTDTLFVYKDIGARTNLSWIIQSPSSGKYAGAKAYFDLKSVNDSMLVLSDSTITTNLSTSDISIANANGEFSINLWPNSLFTNDSSYYTVTVRSAKGKRLVPQIKFRMPDSAGFTVNMKDLTRWK